MQVLTDIDNWADAVSKLSGDVFIATYNVAAFQSRGPVFKILEALNQHNTSIAVGVPSFKSCTDYPDKCRACLSKHKKSLARLAQLRDHYKNIKWLYVKESHTKFAINGSTAIIGGRNLSDSKFHDVSVAIKDPDLIWNLQNVWSNITYLTYDVY